MSLEINDIQVHAISCDGLSANRKFVRISMGVDKSLKIPFKTTNPFDSIVVRFIYFVSSIENNKKLF